MGVEGRQGSRQRSRQGVQLAEGEGQGGRLQGVVRNKHTCIYMYMCVVLHCFVFLSF